jgi:hypothetical protein
MLDVFGLHDDEKEAQEGKQKKRKLSAHMIPE